MNEYCQLKYLCVLCHVTARFTHITYNPHCYHMWKTQPILIKLGCILLDLLRVFNWGCFAHFRLLIVSLYSSFSVAAKTNLPPWGSICSHDSTVLMKQFAGVSSTDLLSTTQMTLPIRTYPNLLWLFIWN